MQPAARRTALLLSASVLLYFWSLNGAGLLILLAPGLTGFSLRTAKKRWKIGGTVLWGLLFSALFHRWSLHYGMLPWLGLTVARGVPWGLYFLPYLLLDGRRWFNQWWEAVSLGAGYTLVCFTLLLGPTGNDWETPMAALADYPWALATLPWLGLLGCAFLIGVSSSLLFTLRKLHAIVGLASLIVWFGLSGILFKTGGGSQLPLSVGLVQTGWSQEKKWDEASREEARERLFENTRTARAEGAELVVWPETAWPHRAMRRRPSDTRAIGRLARKLEVQLLASSIEETETGDWINSVSRVTSEGRFSQEYQKLRLAPFAEYIPLPDSLAERLREYVPFRYIGRFVSGGGKTVFKFGPYNYSILICFESQVPWPTAGRISEIDFMIVVTNDAPIRVEAPKEYHFRSAVLRAAQFQIPFFQASNNGVTGVINSRGEVVLRTDPGFTGEAVLVNPK